MVAKNSVLLEELNAPEMYNIVDDIDLHSSEKVALRFLSENGNVKKLHIAIL